ncbi:MAG: hypothetical protein ACREYE_30170 [Gammaproteobacteria bacterium]
MVSLKKAVNLKEFDNCAFLGLSVESALDLSDVDEVAAQLSEITQTIERNGGTCIPIQHRV